MYEAKRLNGEAVGLYFKAVQDCRNRIVPAPLLRIVEVIAEYASGKLVLESEVVREYNFDATPK